MKTFLIKLGIAIACIGGLYYGLSMIDWLSVLHVEQLSDETEQQIGDLSWRVVRETKTVVRDTSMLRMIDTIRVRICNANDIDTADVHVHIVRDDEVNAYALPGNHIVINSALIEQADTVDEVAGVLCHEIAHLRLGHIHERLVKNIGITALIGATTGSGSTGAIKGLVLQLISTSFDRDSEREADYQAVRYLKRAGISARPLANFMRRLADELVIDADATTWISTHPHPRERAAYIEQQAK